VSRIEKYKNNQARIIYTYKVTEEPFGDDVYPVAVDKLMNKIFKLVSTNPQKAVAESNNAIKIYPDVPTFYNYLCCAYQKLGDHENVKKYTHETCRLFPDYIFGKCAYARLLIEDEKLDEALDIFGGVCCIKQLYPSRDIFHVTELIAFDSVMGICCAKKGMLETATVFSNEIKSIDANHPAANELDSILMIESMKTAMKNIMLKKTKIRETKNRSSNEEIL
jgi:tetratricopeptide (TPR) repeat protein